MKVILIIVFVWCLISVAVGLAVARFLRRQDSSRYLTCPDCGRTIREGHDPTCPLLRRRSEQEGRAE